MKTLKKVVCLLLTPVITLLYFNISLFIQLSLNSTYSVREISETKRLQGLIGIEEVIKQDYKNVFTILTINSIALVVLLLSIITLIIRRK